MRRTLIWTAILAGFWWVLSGAPFKGWYAGVVAVGLAVTAGVGLTGDSGPGVRPRVRARGLLGFIPFFLLRVVQAAVDVSIRAFLPGPQINPDLILYATRLPDGAPRTLFANTISLLPGTFSAELRDDGILVHILARGPESEASLAELERRVGRVFGLSIDSVAEA